MRFLTLSLSALLLFSSCNSGPGFLQSEDLVPTTIVNQATNLESAHESLKAELSTELVLTNQEYKTFASSIETIQNKFNAQKSVSAAWQYYGISEVMSGAQFFVENMEDEDIYQQLATKFDLSEAEYSQLFLAAEIYMSIEQSTTKAMSSGCAWAVAGYATAAMGAAFITGGASLAFWGVSILVAGGSVIDGCS